MVHRYREQYNNFRRGINKRTRILTTPSSAKTHPNMAKIFHHFSHSMPETPETHYRNGPLSNHTYQATQTRGHPHHTTLFRMTNTSHKQQGFYHTGLPRSNCLFYGIFPHEYYIHGLHNSNITANHLEAITFKQARGTIYEMRAVCYDLL